jgi:SAM-dependent methyltransferase
MDSNTMSIETIVYDNQVVPKFISEGHHSQYIYPIAKQFCKGHGLDIGANREDWAFPGSFPIDPKISNTWDAYNLPNCTVYQDGLWDYIFSSHCLEHLPDYMAALELWTSKLKIGGVLFLYLPHYKCKHWRPQYKTKGSKHFHQFDPTQIEEIMEILGYTNIFVSDCDLAFSFAAVGEKT